MKTYKIKHKQNYQEEVDKAKQIAHWAISNKFKTSSKHVKHLGLKSCIANQILKKYGQNKKAKKLSRVKLTIPGANKNIQIKNNQIYVPCLNKIAITPWFDLSQVVKICQIEVDNEYFYITFQEKQEDIYEANEYLGIDLNTNEHFAVISSGSKIIKRGRVLRHIKNKSSLTRRRLQKKLQYRTLKRAKNKESRRTKDLLHKLSREVVDIAKSTGKGIKLEDLKGIRVSTRKKSNRTSRRATNNWNYSSFRFMIEYKSRICGVPLLFIDPRYTSQKCSRCDHIDQANRVGKKFKCLVCGHVDHADANASFNIALTTPLLVATPSKEPRSKGVSFPEEATSDKSTRLETIVAIRPPQATRSLAAW